jgi:hypothetical protein
VKRTLHFLVIGLCSGILLGLALSPVIEKALVILLTFSVSLVGIASGVSVYKQSDHPQFKLDPAPMSWIMIGIVVGSLLGMFTRTHDLLGMTRNAMSAYKKRDSLEMGQSRITGLHSADQDACLAMRSLHGPKLEEYMHELGDPNLDRIIRTAQGDSSTLEAIKSLICP